MITFKNRWMLLSPCLLQRFLLWWSLATDSDSFVQKHQGDSLLIFLAVGSISKSNQNIFPIQKILVRLKETHLQQLSKPPPNLLAFGEKHPDTRIYTRAYHHANPRWKDMEKKKDQDRVFDANIKEKESIKVIV